MSITLIQAITLDEILKKQEAQIATLTAENERLREALVEAAYREGYEDGEDGLGGPFEWCWEDSNTYAALQPKEGN